VHQNAVHGEVGVPGQREGSGGAEDIAFHPEASSSPILPADEGAALRAHISQTYVLDKYSRLYRPSLDRLNEQLRSRSADVGTAAVIKHSIGDGNCLPRAIVDTGLTSFDNYESLKAAALAYLVTHQDETLRL
jgi:hypothetical protein